MGIGLNIVLPARQNVICSVPSLVTRLIGFFKSLMRSLHALDIIYNVSLNPFYVHLHIHYPSLNYSVNNFQQISRELIIYDEVVAAVNGSGCPLIDSTAYVFDY